MQTKSLRIIKKILSSKNVIENKKIEELGFIINKRLLPLLAEADIDDECRMAIRLRKIESKLTTSRTSKAVSGRTIVGIGGRFSAGKSCFINSIISSNITLLPEGQLPTTSISTFIVNGKKRENTILNISGKDIHLNDNEVVALNHQFHEKYDIGFARFVELFMLQTPLLKYKNLALLDTPGYNKYDGQKAHAATDGEEARRELRAVDYLIWLIDIENGVIKNEDISFLQENIIDANTPVLFVINKADKKPPQYVKEIIEQTESVLLDTEIQSCGVVAYSARNCKEFVYSNEIDYSDISNNNQIYINREEGKIEKFLRQINESTAQRMDVLSEVISICSEIQKQLIILHQESINEEQYLLSIAKYSNDIMNIGSVTSEFQHVSKNTTKLFRLITAIRHIQYDINSLGLNKG